MHISRKNVLFSVALAGVEIAGVINLVEYQLFHERFIAALVLGIGFPALLIATSVMIAQDLPQRMRAMLVVGGGIIFLVQAIANVSLAYLRANDIPETARPWRWSLRSSGCCQALRVARSAV